MRESIFEPVGMSSALRRYELLSECIRDIVIFLRQDGQIVEANRAAVMAYGYNRHELLALNARELRAVQSLVDLPEVLSRGPNSCVTFETAHRRKDGSVFPVEVNASLSEFGGLLLAVIRDITQRKRSEAVGRLLHEVDHRILDSEPLEEILADTCSGLMAAFAFPVVWIVTKEAAGPVHFCAPAPVAERLLRPLNVRWDESLEGLGPTGAAVETGQLRVFRFASEQPEDWKETLAGYGLHAGCALPLMARGETFGALTAYVADERLFTDEIRSLLQDFAGRLAVSLLAERRLEQIRVQTAALEAADNAMLITNASGQVLWVNQAFSALTGYQPDDMIGKVPRVVRCTSEDSLEIKRVLQAGESWRGELVDWRKDGREYVTELTITPVRGAGGSISNYIAIMQDVTDRKRKEEQLHHLATHDPLTDLPNRRALRDHLVRVVGRVERGHPGALLLMDLDNFKQVNDDMGHAAGDQMLVSVAQALRQATRPFDLLCRWGGDEFAVLMEDVTSDEAVAVAERLRVMVTELEPPRPGLHVGISIGVAPIDGARDACGVMAVADYALYMAKESGKGRVVLCRTEGGQVGFDQSGR